MKSFKYILFLLFSILFFSCENAVDAHFNETVEKAASQKAYVVFKLVETNNSAVKTASDSRAVSSGVTSALFSHITFSGTRADGLTMTPVTASSFADLSGQSIEIEPGEWTFDLEAWLGKTESADGEKYTASKNLSVVAGANEVKMSLTAASSSAAAPASHPGSWEVSVKFPSDSIDRVEVSLFKYSDFAVAGTNPASLTSLFSEAYVKGSDFTASGQQTLLTGETVRACGNYIVYVSFLKNIDQQGSGSETEVINSWGEFMRINPGVKSTGTITLPNAERVYTIQYILGNSEWNPSYAQSIQVCYTRNSGTNGVFTLPGESAFVDRNPAGTSSTDPNRPYQFLGWYNNADFTGSPITSFNVSDAANKVFYAKWKEPVYDVYVQAGADDSIADGTKAHPFSSVTLDTYHAFYDVTGINTDGSFKSTIHILSDYTGANKITVPWGNNDSSLNGMCVNLVGEKDEVENADVELDVCVGSANSFIYLNNSQQMKLSHINITSTANHTNPNGFGCLSVTNGTALFFEDSTIKGYTAEGCSAINVDGIVYLKNCEISGNKAIDRDSTSEVWANAVYVNSGFLHLDGNVVIKNNKTLKDDGSGDEESEKKYNLYIGSYSGSTLTFHPVIIHGSLADSEIWVKLAQEPRAFTSGYGTQTGSPSDYFHSDSGFLVDLNASGEVQLVRRVSYYVSSTSASPAGSDTAGDGSIEHPYASIAKVIEEITSANDTSLAPVIYITGDVSCNTTIVDGTTGGTQLIANSLIIEGTTATSALNGNSSETVLDLRTSVPVTLKNLTIKNGQSSTRGGGLYIDGTNVDINNCIIENNSAYSQGGGVYLTNGAQLTMNGTGSVIRGNWLTGPLPTSNNTVSTNKCGGGVYIDSGTTFTMNAGTIEGNGAYSGGGVYVRGSFEMNGDTDTTVIQSNMRIAMGNTTSSSILSSTQLTANVEVGIPGTFTMNGGKITSSLSEGQNGAGVCVYASHGNGDENGTATFNMTGGEISGLNISQNAAVFLYADPITGENFSLVFNMSGGKITGNTATSNTISGYGTCAGVYVGRYGAFNMTGGEISHNHARSKAGGVYCENIIGTGLIVPTITLGQTSSASTILIKDNTVGSPAVTGNIYLDEGKTVTVAGALSTTSEVGITRAGAFSATPFTSGYGTTNSGTAPSDIFTSDEAYTIIAGTGGEAAFLTYSPSGTIYAPGDYHFTLAASRSSVTLGRAANVTVTPDITRTEPNGNTTPLFYKAADHKLYLDSAFTQPEGSNAEVTWSASLWCGTEVEVSNLSAGTGANANKFTIPALSFENTYTLNVTATYQGYTHNANLPLQCQTGGAIPSDFVLIPNGSFKRAASADAVTAGEVYTVTISYDFYMCEHEVTQKEWEDVMGFNQNDLLITSTVGSPVLKGAGDDYPVYHVNWYAAIVYCNMRSLAEGLDCVYTVGSIDFTTYDTTSILIRNYSLGNSITADFSKNGYRLPTEAEWEYAALGDYKDNPNWNGYGDSSNANASVFAGYNGTNTVSSYAYDNTSTNHEIKRKLPNSYGLYDMCDNVEEWCWDWYNANQYSIDGNTTDPVGTVYDSERSRVVRGFSWNSQRIKRTVAARHKTSPTISSNQYGLRLVRSAE